MHMPALYPEYWPQFFTATILEWKTLLQQDKYKEEIVKSLRFLVQQKRIKLYAFVIMNNHLHLIWQPMPGQTLRRRRCSASISAAVLSPTNGVPRWRTRVQLQLAVTPPRRYINISTVNVTSLDKRHYAPM
jgi:REP element-mobilizing transposase RayT